MSECDEVPPLEASICEPEHGSDALLERLGVALEHLFANGGKNAAFTGALSHFVQAKGVRRASIYEISRSADSLALTSSFTRLAKQRFSSDPNSEVELVKLLDETGAGASLLRKWLLQGALDELEPTWIDVGGPIAILMSPIRRRDELWGLLIIELDDSASRRPATAAARSLAAALSCAIAQRELRGQRHQQVELVEALMDSIPSPLFYKGTDGTYLGCNRAFEEFVGLSRDEIVGQTVFAVGPPEIAKRYHEADAELFAKGGNQTYEWRVQRKNGEIRSVVFNKAALTDAGGRVRAIAGVILDITDYKRLERELETAQHDLEQRVCERTAELAAANQELKHEIRQRERAEQLWQRQRTLSQRLYESSPQAIAITNANGFILDINLAFERLFGFSREECIGSPMDELILPKGMSPLEEDAGDNLVKHELARKRRDGSLVYTSLLQFTMPLEPGQVATYHLYSDVTELRFAKLEKEKLEAQLRQAQKMEAIGTLAGGIAHDFNNLLQAVTGQVQLLLSKKTPDDEEWAALQEVDGAAQRAADLIRRLLTFSRKVDATFDRLELNSVIENVRQLLSHTLPKNIALRFDLDDQLPSVKGDSTQLEQVVLNVVGNAVDAMPDGGSITVSTSRERQKPGRIRTTTADVLLPAGAYAVMEIRDTGFGMSNEVQEHIFEPFFTTKEVGKGTGLGLSTVYGIVNSHHGHIRCKSVPGEGTTFSIYLPAAANTDHSAVQRANRRVVLPRGHETILVVDDEETILDIVDHMLCNHGYTVMKTTSPTAALGIYTQHRDEIELTLLDLGMPEMTGEQCLRGLKQINPTARVLVSSGYLSHPVARDPVSFGASDFIGKPYRYEDLVCKVRSVLDLPKKPTE